MTLDDLQESLSEILPTGFHIETNKRGQLIVFTGLTCDDDGEIADFVIDEDDEDLDASEDDFIPIEDEDDED